VNDAAVGLTEAIAALRRELNSALSASAGEEVRFRLGQVDLEFQVDVTREAGANGGIKFWVVSLQGKGDLKSMSRHLLKLTLQPVGSDGADLLVGSDVHGRPK
jgi:hypothetical protein